MTPSYRILADDRDIGGILRGRLLNLSIAAHSGPQADTIELRLDDRGLRHTGGRIALLRPGVALTAALGYEAVHSPRAARRPPLTEMGRFTVDERELSGPPATLVVRGKAADMRAALKQHKTRSWDDLRLGKLVAVIAEEHGLLRSVGADLYDIPLPHVDQTDESDMHLLTRLGRQYDAVARQDGEYLLFVRRGQARTASGRRLEPLAVTPQQVSGYRATLADRDRYAAVAAHWRDLQSGERRTVTASRGEPIYSLRHNYIDERTARDAAQAKLAVLQRGVGALSLTLAPGDPRVWAETPLTLSGFRQGIDGPWTTVRVTHNLDDRGYATSLEAETGG